MAKKQEIAVPLIESVAQHELGLLAHIEATEREAAERVEAARREAEALLRKTQAEIDQETAQLRQDAEAARARVQSELDKDSKAQADHLRAVAASRAPEVVAAVMNLILPDGDGSARS